MAGTKKVVSPKKKATVTAQAKGRMAKAQKEQADVREKKIKAYSMSDSNSKRYAGLGSTMKGTDKIAPAQYGNLKPNARNAAKNAAFDLGKPIAKRGK